MGTWLLHMGRDTGCKSFCNSQAVLTQERGTRNFSTARLAGVSGSPNPMLPFQPKSKTGNAHSAWQPFLGWVSLP